MAVREWARKVPAYLGVSVMLLATTACQQGVRADVPVGDPAYLTAERHMVSSAHPLATRAGLEILRAGGSAVDAAIAVQMALTLVEPGESGIGGGGFLLHHDAESGDLVVFDGRETAPASADPRRFVWMGGPPMPFMLAVLGGRSVGVPGLVAMLHDAHEEYGRLPWSELFQPAIELSETGFPVSPRLHRQLRTDPTLRLMGGTRSYFYRWWGPPVPIGYPLRNPALADTLRLIADEGPSAFYEGPIAEDIVRAVRRRALNPGDLTLEDMADYEPLRRAPVCGPYREWTICGPPPPSSGGVTVLQILGMLEHFDMAAMAPDSREAVHVFAEASRLAFADRNAYLGDTDAARAVLPALLDRDYLAGRAALIDPESAMRRARRGDLRPGSITQGEPPAGGDSPSTTHFSVVDGDGNAVALTSSIEQPFGSRLMVRGFILNNQLTDFSFRPELDGIPAPNAVEPGKRPLSAMAPTLVFDEEGNLRLVVGSPGGSRIIGYVAKTLVGVLDWGLDIQSAASVANRIHRNDRLELERRSDIAALAPSLRRMGHSVRVRSLDSGVHGIEVFPDGLRGGADPRREGASLGD